MRIKQLNTRENKRESTARYTLVIKDFQEQLKVSGNLIKFYYDHFDRGSCGHSFDCCGCWSTGLMDVKRVGKNKIVMHIGAARNY